MLWLQGHVPFEVLEAGAKYKMLTLFSYNLQVAINAALGFDTYLVMRHGAGPFVGCESSDDASSSSAG